MTLVVDRPFLQLGVPQIIRIRVSGSLDFTPILSHAILVLDPGWSTVAETMLVIHADRNSFKVDNCHPTVLTAVLSSINRPLARYLGLFLKILSTQPSPLPITQYFLHCQHVHVPQTL